MKKTILILYIFYVNSIASQNVCGIVDYKTQGYITTYSQMVFTKDFSYNQQVNSKKLKNKENIEEGGEGFTRSITIVPKNLDPYFLYNDGESFYFNFDYIDNETDIVKEDKNIWKWNLLTATKKIGKFNCQKATTTFRGSLFTAWFAIDIPVPFGPWKAKDLPGLILELSDSNNLIYIKALKVVLSSAKKCANPVNKEMLKKAISIKEMVQKTKLKDKKYFSRLNSKLPKGAKPYVIAEDCDDCPKDLKLETFDLEN
ncbi:GLPGLI family protein [Polaribacter sp. M15]